MTKLARSSSLLIQPEVFEETLESGQKKHTSGRHPNLRNAKCKQLVRSNLIVLVVGSSLIMGTITLLATTLLKQSIIEGLSSQLPIESTTTTEVNITTECTTTQIQFMESNNTTGSLQPRGHASTNNITRQALILNFQGGATRM
jgi:hypothetical protein